MPPKCKLYKNTGKSKTLPPKLPESEDSSNSDQEFEQQFEMELCWCIQQLQMGLKNGKLNNKQIQEHTKAVNILMCNTTPIIRKRQVMRLSFGDYRAKMAEEERKSKNSSTKLKLTPALPHKKSFFIKKSVFSQSSGENFRFNFSDQSSDFNKDLLNMKISEETEKLMESTSNDTFKFLKSNNAFQFNFCTQDS